MVHTTTKTSESESDAYSRQTEKAAIMRTVIDFGASRYINRPGRMGRVGAAKMKQEETD